MYALLRPSLLQNLLVECEYEYESESVNVSPKKLPLISFLWVKKNVQKKERVSRLANIYQPFRIS